VNILQVAEEIQDDQGKDGGTNIHEDGKIWVFQSVGQCRKVINVACISMA